MSRGLLIKELERLIKQAAMMSEDEGDPAFEDEFSFRDADCDAFQWAAQREGEHFASSLQDVSPDETDEAFNKQRNINNHENCYTDILNAYTESLQETLKRKLKYKTLIFWLSFVLLGAVPLVLALILLTKDFESLSQWCAVVIPALVSFLTIFIVIPQVITEYLFNAEEEKYMSDVIKNIQDYDKNK